MIIYVVRGETGDREGYEAYSEWPVRAFTDEDDAKAFVVAATKAGHEAIEVERQKLIVEPVPEFVKRRRVKYPNEDFDSWAREYAIGMVSDSGGSLLDPDLIINYEDFKYTYFSMNLVTGRG